MPDVCVDSTDAKVFCAPACRKLQDQVSDPDWELYRLFIFKPEGHSAGLCNQHANKPFLDTAIEHGG